MKNFFKKASIYIFLMLLAAGIIFSLNYYYGQKISEDIEAEITQTADNNDYQLKSIEIDTNPFLQKIELQNLSLNRTEEVNIIVNQAEINFSWQQLLNYIQNQDFQLDKNLESQIKQIKFSSLEDNYQLDFSDLRLDYQGNLSELRLAQLKSIDDLHLLLEKDHNLDFRAAELKYDFPYYRSYGLNNDNWDRISTFDDFILKADYNKDTQKLNIEEFNLSSELLTLIFNLDSDLVYDKDQKEITVEQLKGNYDFNLAADNLDFEANSFFQDLEFKQFDFNGGLNLSREEDFYKANQLDFNLNLSEFKLLLSEALSQQVNQNTLGILAADNKFEILIDKFSYQQNYDYPNGSSQSELNSSLINAEFEAEYNYSEETPYLSSSHLRYKPQNEAAEQLNSFLQIILEKSIERNEAGFYELEIWGDLDDLNFE
ncbi:MAG: hypothetical protein ACLFUK_06255 [Halanaerobium sp.]